MKTALLIIDVQKDYFPGGKYPLVNPLEASKKAYMLLRCFREHGGYHVHIQQILKEPDATSQQSENRQSCLKMRQECPHQSMLP